MRTRSRLNRSFRNAIDSLEARRLMATFVVANAKDAGAGSLRWAIDQANATTAADTVTFAIGSGAATINLASTLTITQPVTIDATTQPGYAGTPLVRLANAGTASSGLYVNAAGSVVRGLSITGMGTAANPNDGTAISVVKQNITIEKCYIGLPPAGSALGNQNDGIGIGVDGDGAIIRDNVISSNGGDGVQVSGDNVVIQGNKIGTSPSGLFANANLGHGVHNLGVIGLLVGGDLPAQGNLISSNGLNGVFFANLNAKGSVFNNFIGTTITGNGKLANGNAAVQLRATTGVVVGDFFKGNRIGGNGVLVSDNATQNKIHSNAIGVGVNPILDVGDAWGIELAAGYKNQIEFNTVGWTTTGIRVTGNDNYLYANKVGTTDAPAGGTGASVGNTTGIVVNGDWNRLLVNSVANNSSVGVHVQSGNQNSIDNNRIWANGFPIKLEPGTNSDLVAPNPANVSQDPSTGEWNVDLFWAGPTVQGEKRTVSFYQSDTPGNAAAGDMQNWVKSVTFTTQSAYTTFNAADFQDGKYLTLTVTKSYLNNGVISPGATSMPTKAVLLDGLPAVYSSKFEYDTGHAWSFAFSDNVGASLTASDLSIRNAATNALYQPSSVTWNAATRTARFVRSTPLPDGNYVAAIKTASISNANGANIENFPLDFHVLQGDANRDKRVNFDDLLILASNYNTTGKTFSQGNFNYSANGAVNFDDLLTLASKYNTFAPAGLPAPLNLSGNGSGNNDDSAGNDVLA